MKTGVPGNFKVINKSQFLIKINKKTASPKMERENAMVKREREF